jgi:hypothetical protein
MIHFLSPEGTRSASHESRLFSHSLVWKEMKIRAEMSRRRGMTVARSPSGDAAADFHPSRLLP